MAEIETVAVIGAGKLGGSIACVTALAGYRTILEDILPASLRRAESEIRDTLDQLIRSGKVSSRQAEPALERIEYAGSLEEAARQADLVIEAVPDEMESKLEIFTLLDKIARPHTILASTTAALSVSDIASITYRRDKVVGLRLDEAAVAKTELLLQIVHSPGTSEETLAACLGLGQRMGRKVVVTREDVPVR